MKHSDLSNQPTYPFPTFPSFHEYLQHYGLIWADVAQRAGVPVIVVWSIDHGLAVSLLHADRVRYALANLTGVPFTGPLATIPGQ